MEYESDLEYEFYDDDKFDHEFYDDDDEYAELKTLWRIHEIVEGTCPCGCGMPL